MTALCQQEMGKVKKVGNVGEVEKWILRHAGLVSAPHGTDGPYMG